MSYYEKNYLILVILIAFCNVLNSQTIFNKDWVQVTGLPGSVQWNGSGVNWSGCTFDPCDHFIITGNTMVSPGNSDILTTMYDRNGNVIWQRQYNHPPNNKDYGVAVCSDSLCNVYVTGAVTAPNGNFDIILLKYSNTGSLLWARSWKGADSLHDVPSAITLDDSCNVYITGGTLTSSSQSNYVTLKYNTNGNLKWVRTYDYANLYELATGIQFYQPNGSVIVTGTSASAANCWDYATLRYSAINGTALDTSRENATGVTINQALAVTRDGSGNVYITGYADSSGNKNIQTIKLNSNFGLVWVKNYYGEGLEDIGKSIQVDNLGNVYITGHTKKQNGGTDYITIKYNSSGNVLWERRYKAPVETNSAEGIKLILDNSHNVYVTGSVYNNGTIDYCTIRYDSIGTLCWEAMFNGYGNGTDIPTDIQTDDNGNIFVTGLAQDSSSTTRYTTVKYSSFYIPQGVIFNNDSTSNYMQNQVIVKFKPEIVNQSFVNNPDKQFGELSEIIPNNVIQLMGNKLGVTISGKTFTAKKIYTRMTTADSISITRLGDTISMDKFWSTFLIIMPTNINVTNAVDSLNTMYPTIYYAEKNYFLQFYYSPDDSLTLYQSSLFPDVLIPYADINIDPAWDIETGKNYVNVGMIDAVIDWSHEDFGNGTFSGSKIKGGWNYINNVSISNSTPLNQHGTACAGIIGALRNNGTGIAGIAGGDVNDSTNTGASLYSFGIGFSSNNGTSNSVIANAIVEASSYCPGSPPYGYGMHILSNSWGGTDYDNNMENAVKSCYNNRCVFVVSRGNLYYYGDTSDLGAITYPSCYNKDWVLSVGGSGNDGKHKLFNFNGDNIYESMIGRNMDVIAPGSFDIVVTPLATGFNQYEYFSIDPNYTRFTGTSSACPHVAGVAALLLSRHNTNQVYQNYPNNLDPDDIEYLIKEYATDVSGTAPGPFYTYNYNPYPDDFNGYGRVNAGNTMDMINKPHYWVQHNLNNPTQTLTTTSNQNINITSNNYGLVPGTYVADKVRIDNTYHTTLSSTSQFFAFWERNKEMWGISGANPQNCDPWANYYNIGLYQGIVTVQSYTFCLHITADPYNNPLNIWIPDIPSKIRTDFSMHIYDPTASVDDLATEQDFLEVYPNPTDNIAYISFLLKKSANTSIKLLDITGQVVKTIENSRLNTGSHLLQLNVNDLSSGVYFIQFKEDNTVVNRKLVISH